MAFDATGFAQEFGAQVRAVRKYEKITQMELAWMVGLSDKTIRDIERGCPARQLVRSSKSPKSSALSWLSPTPSPNPSSTPI